MSLGKILYKHPDCHIRTGRVRRVTKFTLVELLIVIAIIIVLAGLLLPALRRAKGKVYQTYCANNQKQISIAINGYLGDNNEYYPVAQLWTSSLYSALNIQRTGYGNENYVTALSCPSDQIKRTVTTPKRSYSISYRSYAASREGIAWINGSRKLAEIRIPSNTILITDYWTSTSYFGSTNYLYITKDYIEPSGYHDDVGGRNYLFCDGHIRFITSGVQATYSALWSIDE